MTGPAAITAIRAPTDLLRKEVELDAPSSASPSLRQKPPKGRIRILYSVSPLVREKIFGPMPTANSCTQMPFFFAIIKCPNSCAITRTPRSIMVINNEEMAEFAANTAKKILGEDEVITSMPGPNLGGEDFAYYAEQKPSVFMFLSSSNPEKQTNIPHHNPKFNIDEDVLYKGSAMFVALAEDFL